VEVNLSALNIVLQRPMEERNILLTKSQKTQGGEEYPTYKEPYDPRRRGISYLQRAKEDRNILTYKEPKEPRRRGISYLQ
jgi:hypothetical protein